MSKAAPPLFKQVWIDTNAGGGLRQAESYAELLSAWIKQPPVLNFQGLK